MSSWIGSIGIRFLRGSNVCTVYIRFNLLCWGWDMTHHTPTDRENASYLFNQRRRRSWLFKFSTKSEPISGSRPTGENGSKRLNRKQTIIYISKNKFEFGNRFESKRFPSDKSLQAYDARIWGSYKHDRWCCHTTTVHCSTLMPIKYHSFGFVRIR